MTENDRPEFALSIASVYDYYGRELSDGVIKIWWDGLKVFDLAAVKEALGRHAMNPDTGQFIPKLADVVKMLGGSSLDSALIALAKAERAMGSVGVYRSVAFDDPLIHVVIEEMGGWVQFGMCKGREWDFRRTEFLNRYRSYKTRGQIPAYSSKLVGIADSENGQKGYAEGAVCLIGEAAIARAVLAGGTTMGRLGPVTVFDAAAETFAPMLEKRDG